MLVLLNRIKKKWYDAVKRLQGSGKNMTDENVYRKELYAFLSSNNKIKLGDKLKKQIGTVDLIDRNILDIMNKTLVARRAAKGSQT